MKVSVIIPTYKDIVALKLILDALSYQTYKDFEVIVAEDDNLEETKRFIQNYKSDYKIKHFSQEDKGNRKPKIVNTAIKNSDAKYIIFIDGDTIPYSTFIDSHVKLSHPFVGLCGRRVNLGDKVSKDLRENKITSLELEKSYLKYFHYIKNDNSRHYEQGIYLKPKSFLHNILTKLNTNANIVASNFSCYKDRLIEVNGIDEGLPYAPSRDDTDLQWRLEAIGVKMLSCKYSANLFHLNHSRDDREEEDRLNMHLINIKKQNNEFRCKKGIYKC